MTQLTVTILPAALSVAITPPAVAVGTGTPVARSYVNADPYEGEYTITPGPEAQILECANMRMTDNLTVAAIPSNYGLISWSGSVLTVT